jgi:hypothetical protein
MLSSRFFKAAGNFFVFKARELIKRKAHELRMAKIKGSEKIIVGPWLGEVGFEVLYWIPFLHFLVQENGFDPSKFVVISRGGVKNWYSAIGRIDYFDIFDAVSPNDFKKINDRRLSMTGSLKQWVMDQDEISILEKTLGRPVGSDLILHPREMYSRFNPYWKNVQSSEMIVNQSTYKKFTPASKEIIERLGLVRRNYVSAKFYFSNALTDCGENIQGIIKLLIGMAKHRKVVLLQSGTKVDDHSDVMGELFRHPNIMVPDLEMKPADNLEMQSQIVGNSSMFIGTYGGFSYLAPFYGVKSIACFSERTFQPAHNDVMLRALLSLQKDSNCGGPEFICASLKGILEIVDGLNPLA